LAPDAGLTLFATHLTQRGVSPRTRSAYIRDAKALVDWCREQGITHCADIDLHRIRAFIAREHRRGLNPRSAQRRLSSLRAFFDCLIESGTLHYNPASGVRAPKARRRLPEVMDVDQTARLLSSTAQATIAVRDQALMELIYSSGLRLSETVALDIAHVDLNDGMVEVTGKGNKTRRVPVGCQAIAALQHWLALAANLRAPGETALFVSARGTRLSARSVQMRIAHWAQRMGLGMNVHPHMLRHAFASHVLESSGDLRAVQELLGHANLSTTQVYTHLNFQHLSAVYDNAHPRARRRPQR
jgi:integrase/recombinase XerC